MNFVKATLLVSSASAASKAERMWDQMKWGNCEDIVKNLEPVKNFDVDGYTGTWFEVQRAKDIFFEEPGVNECITARYTNVEWNVLYPITVNNGAYNLATGELSEEGSNSGWNMKARARYDDEDFTGSIRV